MPRAPVEPSGGGRLDKEGCVRGCLEDVEEAAGCNQVDNGARLLCKWRRLRFCKGHVLLLCCWQRRCWWLGQRRQGDGRQERHRRRRALSSAAAPRKLEPLLLLPSRKVYEQEAGRQRQSARAHFSRVPNGPSDSCWLHPTSFWSVRAVK